MLGLSLHGWENAMVVSLIIAGFFALIAGAATWAVVRLQRMEIAASDQELTKYKLETAKEIADATARTAEAELKLGQIRQLAGPRGINVDVFKKELDGKPKAPVEIWYLPDSSDGYWFAGQLRIALSLSGWQVNPWFKPLPEPDQNNIVLRGVPRSVVAGGQPWGVTVVGDAEVGNGPMNNDTPGQPAFSALFEALSKSTNFGMYGSNGSQFTPVPRGAIRVVVAAKTDPMFADPISTPITPEHK